MLTVERYSRKLGKRLKLFSCLIAPHDVGNVLCFMYPLQKVLTPKWAQRPYLLISKFFYKTIFVNLASCEGNKIVKKKRQNVIIL